MAMALAILLLALPSAPQEPGPDRLLLPSRSQQVPEWLADNARRVDPAADGWRTEVLHDSAKHHLHEILDSLFAGAAWDDAPLAPDFRFTTLRPELEVVRDSAALQLWRARTIPELRRPREAFGEALAEFHRHLSDRDAVLPAASFAKLVTVEALDERSFRTHAIVHAHADRRGGGIAQWNLEADLTWTIGADEEDVRLQDFALTAYEEGVSPLPLLQDYGYEVFGDTPTYAEHVLLGTEDYTHRVDHAFGRSYIGAQGIAVGDVNGDGLDDVFLAQQAGLPHRLYLARADGTAEEVSARARVDFLDKARGVLLCDFDGDGDQDLALSTGPNLTIAWNDGDGTFGSRTYLRGPGSEEIYSLAAADPDGDGDLDVYACRYVKNGLLGGVPTPYHDARNGAPNVYWRNDGDHGFTIATEEVGLDDDNTRFSLAAAWEDLDGDGDLDLYVVNDFGRNSFYVNEGGQFREAAVEHGVDDMAAGMGITIGDVDRDLDLDLYVTNMFSSAGRRIASQDDLFMGGRNRDLHGAYVRHARGNTLLVQEAGGRFRDATDEAGVAIGMWGWGAVFFDLENDGWLDAYCPNGFLTNERPKDL